jgi:hypothetical protein
VAVDAATVGGSVAACSTVGCSVGTVVAILTSAAGGGVSAALHAASTRLNKAKTVIRLIIVGFPFTFYGKNHTLR